MCGWRPNSYEIYKSRRWGDCTYARASPVSLSRKPLSPDIEASPKTNLPISFALARSSPNMASYWFIMKLRTRRAKFYIFPRVALAMTNDYIFEFYHPLLSDTAQVGGGHITPPSNLPHPPYAFHYCGTVINYCRLI